MTNSNLKQRRSIISLKKKKKSHFTALLVLAISGGFEWFSRCRFLLGRFFIFFFTRILTYSTRDPRLLRTWKMIKKNLKTILYPQSMAYDHGRPNSNRAATEMTANSVHHGTMARNRTLPYSFLSADGSKSNPALVNITVNAIFLKSKTQKRLTR